MSADAFRSIGHELIDMLADFFDHIGEIPVSPDGRVEAIRENLGPDALPEKGVSPNDLIISTAEKLVRNSVHNGHPRFWAYITSSADPVGVLADLLASSINQNLALWRLAPLATEIELQTIRWMAELLRYPTDCGGVLVSGGNVANFVCTLAARAAKARPDLERTGHYGGPKLTMYVSEEVHTWVDKAAGLFGIGSEQVRWIGVDDQLKMRVDLLADAVRADREAGHKPFLVVGTAGTVGTGAVDPISALSDFCSAEDLWFHVDGAYGAFASAAKNVPADMHEIHRADSIAVDPHKWLYAPLEAGCALVRRAGDLERTFSHDAFYLRTHFGVDERPVNFVDLGLQNSRGFRALKVWMGLQTSGRAGVISSIEADIDLSKYMAECLSAHANIEVVTQSLSIVTFRYVPDSPGNSDPTYLDNLNAAIMQRLQDGGVAFLSQAKVRGAYLLRACIVNYRTTKSDVESLAPLVVAIGKAVDREMRAEG